MMFEACRRLFQSISSANRMSIRFSLGDEDKAYFYSFKNYVYISVSMRKAEGKSVGYRMAILLVASSFTGVKGRIRLLATILASIALIFLNGFVPLGTVVTLVMIAVAVALLVIAFVIAKNLGRVTVSNEEEVEELHRRLYSVNSQYRTLFNAIQEFSNRIFTLVMDFFRGRNPSSIHIPSFGIYSVKGKREENLVELELSRVVAPPKPP